jgi:hypothetical protein
MPNLNNASASFNSVSGRALHDPSRPTTDDKGDSEMITDLKRKLAVAGVAVLGVSGIGAGVAAAQTTPPKPQAPVTSSATSQSGGTVAQGNQTTPDAPGVSEKPGAESPELAGTEKAGTETAGTEEPGDANLPGGGHADAPGSTVDTQFQGVQ